MSSNKENNISNEEVLDTSKDASKPKPPSTETNNKNGGLNALLFIGSFLIVVGACSLIGSAVADIVKLYLTLAMVIVFYIAGLLIRRIKILVPAGTAFTCTALAVMPFLGFVFSRFPGVSQELSWLLTSLVGTIAYIYVAYIFRSRVITFFSFGFVVSLFCSMPTVLHMATLWNFLSVIFVSIIANFISILFKDKIPKDFRAVLTHTARWLAAIVAFTTIFTESFTLVGYDYSIIFSICLAQYIFSYLTAKDYADEVLGRIVAFPLFLSLFWNVFPANSSEFALIFALACISQVIYSFFSSMLRPEKRNREISFIIVFMIFSLFSPLFITSSKAVVSIAPNIIAIIITSINLILTILLSVTWKQKAWLFASYPLAFLLPLYFEAGENQSRAVLIAYALEFILFSAYYYFQKEHKKGLELFNLISFSAVIVMTRMGIHGSANEPVLAKMIIMNTIAFVVPAFCWLVFGLREENKNKIEISFYFFITCIFATFTGIINQTVSSGVDRISSFMFSTIFIIAMLTMASYRKSRARAIVGTSIFTYLALMMVFSSNLRTSYSLPSDTTGSKTTIDYVISLLFLLEEIIIAVYSSVKKDKAVFWISASGIILITFSLTSGATYLWLIFAGLAIIGFVIWRLIKTNQKQDSLPKQTPPGKKEIDKKSEPSKD